MLTELLKEVEDRLRLIIREEKEAVLSDAKTFTNKAKPRIQSDRNFRTPGKDFPSILTAKEVAEILGVGVQRVYELARGQQTQWLSGN